MKSPFVCYHLISLVGIVVRPGATVLIHRGQRHDPFGVRELEHMVAAQWKDPTPFEAG
jgi:hypothetical protein